MKRSRRLLHPGAWWAWAAATAAAALRTTNPLILLLIIAAVSFVVAQRRQAAPWARSFGSFFKLAIFVVVLRVILQVLFGARVGDVVLVDLPAVDLPSWAPGVSIGGTVTLELVLASVYSSLQLATVLICFGAVNSLCSPYRLLRSLPAVLYEAGVVVTVALSFAPQMVLAIGHVRDARRLRGRPVKGVRGLRGMAMPVLETALDRSIELASSMDARGYGRRGDLSARSRRIVTTMTGAGLLLILVGTYALLDAGAPRALSLPVLAVGAAALSAGLLSRGRHSQRTRYRADRWLLAEWLVTACGVAALGAMVLTAQVQPEVLTPSLVPLAWPELALAPVVAASFVLLPGWIAPAPPLLLDVSRADDDRSGVDPATPVVDAPQREAVA